MTSTSAVRRAELAPPQPALSDEDVLARVLVQLYSKLAVTLGVAQTVGRPGDVLFSLAVPGESVEPHLDPDDPVTQYRVANALDATLTCNWRVQPGVATISGAYRAILDGKETPIVSLTTEQQELLLAASHLLAGADGEPTETYTTYLRYRDEYLAARDALEAAQATHDNGGPPVTKRLVRAVEDAEDRWQQKGRKEEVARALAVVATYEAFEPELYWRRLITQFDEWTQVTPSSSRFQIVTSFPPYEEWFDEAGWSELSFDTRDYERQQRSGATGLGAGCPPLCACDGVPARPSATAPRLLVGERGDEPVPFVLTAKLRRVAIVRPWMDTNVFGSRAWRWSPASIAYGTVISTGGDIAGASVPTGVMPVLPMEAVLARDVELWWEDDGSVARDLPSWLAGRPDVAFGPFRLADGQAVDGIIRYAGVHIIGFLSSVLPRCPNPDPLLQWPDHGKREAFPRPRRAHASAGETVLGL